MAENLGYLPTRIVAGETIWIAAANTLQDGEDIVVDNVTSPGYALAYQFSAATPITVSAAASGSGWTLTVTAAQTLLWKAGTIRYVGMATAAAPSSKVFAVDVGEIQVTASPLAVSEYAAALAAIETAIANYATSPARSFTLGDMSVTYGALDELLKLRDFYKGEVAQQTSQRMKRIIRTRFT